MLVINLGAEDHYPSLMKLKRGSKNDWAFENIDMGLELYDDNEAEV